ncbi:MAG: hypothetical protein M3Z24_17015, partial [Chloroflexota bacterium]|nr:hypothetical protein [Chloroflexota bacterium]
MNKVPQRATTSVAPTIQAEVSRRATTSVAPTIQAAWIMLLLVLLLGMVVMPVRAASTVRAQQGDTATTVGATIYVTTATLRPMFQARINQQVPVAFSNALAGIVGKLP